MPIIKELPASQRPREKLWTEGKEALSNTELLALLIGSGTQGKSAIALAMELLAIAKEGIGFFLDASPEELMHVPGIGIAKAAQIIAGAELGKRMAAERKTCGDKISSPEDVAGIFMEDLRRLKQEHCEVLLLNLRGHVIGREIISIGSLSGSVLEARDVLRPAIRRGAASVVLVHNHPSGNPEPSMADIETTKRIMEASKVLDICVTDHLIIGDGEFVSMKRRKLL
ncbi:MAG: DNA repair protein RadC [Clostridiales Family XIII bacterium]|nr:DNA repair protein RadC [Clostridiales Family XIII bacterium]